MDLKSLLISEHFKSMLWCPCCFSYGNWSSQWVIDVFHINSIPRKYRKCSLGCLYPILRLHLTPICCVKVTGPLLLALSRCCHNCWQVRPSGPRSESLLGLQMHPFLCQLLQLFLHCPVPGKVNLTQGSNNVNDVCMVIRLCVVFHRPGLFPGGMLTYGSFHNTLGSFSSRISEVWSWTGLNFISRDTCEVTGPAQGMAAWQHGVCHLLVGISANLSNCRDMVLKLK